MTSKDLRSRHTDEREQRLSRIITPKGAVYTRIKQEGEGQEDTRHMAEGGLEERNVRSRVRGPKGLRSITLEKGSTLSGEKNKEKKKMATGEDSFTRGG